MDNTSSKTIVSWATPEFIYYKKTKGWFAGFGIIAVTLFIILLLMKNYLFALLMPIVSFLIYIYAKKYPRQITIKITNKGIEVGKHLSLVYEEIASFWIFEEPEIRSLNLITKKVLQPKISILIADKDPVEIRKILMEFIKEERQEEHLIDAIARKLKF